MCISDSFDATTTSIDASVNVFYLLYAASLVFLMQSGFAMVSAGCVRTNNVQNTLLKNLLDACGAALGFYSVGYAFAWGGSTDETTAEVTFIG
jgi:Amt family ammonium transporter